MRGRDIRERGVAWTLLLVYGSLFRVCSICLRVLKTGTLSSVFEGEFCALIVHLVSDVTLFF